MAFGAEPVAGGVRFRLWAPAHARIELELEPAAARFLPARWLDIVFVPLVGFDDSGMRLGMGAGYYDRAFGFLRLRRAWRAPLLVGIGYASQEVDRIVSAAHDVPLDLVITELGVIHCANR